MSKVVRFAKIGGPEVLSFEDVDVRLPEANEIRITSKALGVSRADSMFRRDEYLESPILPAGLGYEVAGIVEALGPNVTGFAVGDKVNVLPAFSTNKYSMYGELVVAPIHAVVHQPPGLSFEEASSIWMMFITAWGGLIELAKLTAGDAVVIPAASSSVGIASIQIGNMVGATTIALTRTAAKRQQLLDAGAKHVVVTDDSDLTAEILRITEGNGARVIFDPVGGPDFPKLISAVAKFGQVIVYGALSNQVTPLPMLGIIGKLPTIQASSISAITTNPVRQKAAVAFVLQGLMNGDLKPVIDSKFKFADIVKVHQYLENNGQFGKIVVTF